MSWGLHHSMEHLHKHVITPIPGIVQRVVLTTWDIPETTDLVIPGWQLPARGVLSTPSFTRKMLVALVPITNPSTSTITTSESPASFALMLGCIVRQAGGGYRAGRGEHFPQRFRCGNREDAGYTIACGAQVGYAEGRGIKRKDYHGYPEVFNMP